VRRANSDADSDTNTFSGTHSNCIADAGTRWNHVDHQ
jgi:hypothetical protein